MNIQLKDVDNVVFNGIDISAVKFNDVLVWQKWETIEYTGVVPVTVTANGEPLLDYLISGNMQQTGTPSPQNVIFPEECGERTAQLFDKDSATVNYYVESSSGNLVYGTRYFASDYIEVEQGEDYYWNDAQRANAGAFYDNNKQYISGWSSAETRYIFTVPNGAKYVRLTGDKQNIDTYMLSKGSTALPYEPYGYKLDISSGGENLFDKSNDALLYNATNLATSGKWSYGSTGVVIRIPCEADTGYTLSCNIDTSVWRISTCSLDDIPTSVTEVDVVDIQRGKPTSGVRTFTTNSVAKYILFQVGSSSIEQARAALMLNLGSTAKPYTPYNRTTTPIYLGEVPTTRQVKKLVFDGTENWTLETGTTYNCTVTMPLTGYHDAICSHYQGADSYAAIISTNNSFAISKRPTIFINDNRFATVADFKAYLAAQYAAGTPVTVWYVLATEQTGILNEPLRKIGDYADSISAEQAQVQIPTISGVNVVDVETTLKPSSIYLKYKGKT